MRLMVTDFQPGLSPGTARARLRARPRGTCRDVEPRDGRAHRLHGDLGRRRLRRPAFAILPDQPGATPSARPPRPTLPGGPWAQCVALRSPSSRWPGARRGFTGRDRRDDVDAHGDAVRAGADGARLAFDTLVDMEETDPSPSSRRPTGARGRPCRSRCATAGPSPRPDWHGRGQRGPGVEQARAEPAAGTTAVRWRMVTDPLYLGRGVLRGLGQGDGWRRPARRREGPSAFTADGCGWPPRADPRGRRRTWRRTVRRTQFAFSNS